MRICTRFGVLLSAVLLFVSLRVSAHEFWLEPLDFRIAANDRLSAHIKVGQHFNGDTQPYIPGNTQTFRIELAGTELPVDARIGDIPALDQAIDGEGLAIVSHVSNDFELLYAEPGLFESFLQYDGLLFMLAEHKRRGLPLTGFKELYQRFAKSLVMVGRGEGEDRRLGERFEWVLGSNPYRSASEPLHAKLYWQGQPLAGVQARLFVKNGRRISERVLITDAAGRVEFTPPAGSQVMLNAVHMLDPGKTVTAATGAVWKSYWASTTFALP